MLESDGLDGLGSVGSESLEFVAPSLFPKCSVGAFNEIPVFQCCSGEWVGNSIGVVLGGDVFLEERLCEEVVGC